MPDDTTQPAAPDYNQAVTTLLSQISQDPMASYQQYMGQQQGPPVSRSITSLLGEALAGGAGPGLTDAQAEMAGSRALLNFGINMLAASGPSYMRKSFGQVMAAGLGGAQEGEISYENQIAAWQQQQMKNAMELQQMRLGALKEAIPLLQLQALHSVPSSLAGGAPAGPGGDYASAIAAKEGLGKNPNSSAFGVGQFLGSLDKNGQLTGTWGDFAKANPSLFPNMTPQQILDARSDPKIGNAAINWLANQNAGQLTSSGIPVSGQSLGMSHYVGPGAVAKMWAAPDSDPVSKYVSADALAANAELRNMTVGQLKGRYATMPTPSFGTAAATPAGAPAAAAVKPAMQVGGIPPAPPGGPAGAVTGPLKGFGQAIAGPPITTSPTLRGPGTPVVGTKVGGDVGAIAGGMQTAMATPVVPGTGLEAGPSSAVATLAQPQPFGSQPATSYSFGPGGTMATQPPQPAPITQPVVPTAPSSPPATFTYDYPALPPAIQAQVDRAMQLTPQEQANAAITRRSYETAIAAAMTPQDRAKAEADLQTALTKENENIRQHQENANKIQTDFYTQDRANKFNEWSKAHEIALSTQADIQKNTQAQVLKISTDQLGDMQKQAGVAQNVMNILNEIGPTLSNQPDGLAGAILHSYPEALPYIRLAGYDPDKVSNAQALQALSGFASLSMRPPQSGAFRELEINNLQGSLPNLLQDARGRQEALARLKSIYQRTIDEYTFAQNHMLRPDANGNPTMNLNNLYPAMQQPMQIDPATGARTGGGLGHVIAEPPPMSASDADYQTYKKYVQNNLRAGMPYYDWRKRTDPTTNQTVLGQDGRPIYDMKLFVK
jgi:hypothetical protein